MKYNRIKHTYTVSWVEEITDKDLEEFGKVMEDEPMTIEKYLQHERDRTSDDGAECLESADNSTFQADIQIIGGQE